ncbi:hypothetical protein DICVIV_03565 [Dictyocaulus viviparus]|uniref:Transcription factor Pcc1 n=1 Tax=Dictyocaulus viviparus TaxID=29172 RepID=A0A0D8Y298_DICVI|nr:hypothetical protein DICVIV_03565 [Dictyocaulus viviparus]
METGDEECSSSYVECGTHESVRLRSVQHSASINLDLDSEDIAEKVFRVLNVDKDPNRSHVTRKLSVNGCHLHIDIVSMDRTSLRKSMVNVLEMCDLAKATIDLVHARKWLNFDE